MSDDTVEQPKTTPPGWYDDGQGNQRWYDGFNWTETVAESPELAAKRIARQEKATERANSAAKKAAVKAVKMAARDEKKHLKEVRVGNRHFDERHNEWLARVTDMEDMLTQAQQFHGRESNEILLKKGELLYASIPGGIIEDRAGKREFVAGHQGVSLPIGKIGGRSVRYYVGQTKGHAVQAPPVATLIDTGRIVITNQRVVFQGLKQTRESLFTKLVGYEHLGVGDTVVSVSNRQKPTRLHYASSDSNEFQFMLVLALADFRGQTSELVKELHENLSLARAEEPKILT